MQKLTDEQLMRMVLDKQRPALEELYDRYSKLVFSFAIKSVRDTHMAKEIVQAVFTRLWTTESGYDMAKGRFVNWILTITRNLTIDYIRLQRKHEQTVPFSSNYSDLLEDRRDHPETVVERKVLQQHIREACRYLSESQVHLLELLYWKGYTLSEIAKLNDEPIGTVKSRLHQALKILRKQLHVIREERLR